MATSSFPPEEYAAALEAELRENFDGKDGLLSQMLAYQLGWTDEQGATTSGLEKDQLLPYLSLLSCSSLAGDFSSALPAAACMAMVDGFIQIHEDVQTGSPQRDGRPAVWWVWGPGQAINAGDGVHALARLALMKLEAKGAPIDRTLEALRILDRSCVEMCEGQHLDLAFQDRTSISTDAYLKMASSKVGALVSCAAGLGALAATDDPQTIDAFRDFGRSLGVAKQILKDVDALWSDDRTEGTTDHIQSKKKLFPVVLTMEMADSSSRRNLDRVYMKRVLEPEDVAKIISILDENDARQQSIQKVAEYTERADSCLEKVTLSWDREPMKDVIRYITSGNGQR